MIGAICRRNRELALVQIALDYMAVLVIFGVILLSAGCEGRESQLRTVPPEPAPALSLAEATHNLDVLARDLLSLSTQTALCS